MKNIYLLASVALIGFVSGSFASSPGDGAGEPSGLRGPKQPVGDADRAAVPRQQVMPDLLRIKGVKGVSENLIAMTGINLMIDELDNIKKKLPKNDPAVAQYIVLLKGILQDRFQVYNEIREEYLKPGTAKKQALSRTERLTRNLIQFERIQGEFLNKVASIPGVDNENLRSKLLQMSRDLNEQYNDLVNKIR